MPNTDPQVLYGEQYFAAYKDDPRRTSMQDAEYKRLTARLDVKIKKPRVYDIGCGLGDFLLRFTGWEKYGREISVYAQQIAEGKGIVFRFDPRMVMDCVVMRGSLQHVPDPIETLKDAYSRLRPGGLLAIIATPDAGGLIYRLFQDLPALSADFNYVVFSGKMLANVLKQLGFVDIEILHPYSGTPYAHPLRDAWRFLVRLLRGKGKPDFAWPGNMMEVYARKPRPQA